MVNYNIADLISRINNNFIANKSLVYIPKTKDNYQILTQLTKLGIINIIGDVKIKDNKKQEFIQIKLYPFCINSSTTVLYSLREKQLNFITPFNYIRETHLENLNLKKLDIKNISFYSPLNDSLQNIKSKKFLKLISKPGKRVYISYKNIKDFNHGHKLYLLRTSKGIISSQTAIKYKIGGELLLKISYSFN